MGALLFPHPVDGDDRHFEASKLLVAAAVETKRARLGVMVPGNFYRNRDVLADTVRTAEDLSGVRAYLGIGARRSEPDNGTWGYSSSPADQHQLDLEPSPVRIRSRLTTLTLAPVGQLPIVVGVGGKLVTLLRAATYGDV